MMRTSKLSFIVIAMFFLVFCNSSNKYYSPELYKSFSIRVPVSWDSIAYNYNDGGNQGQILCDKFIGERNMQTGMVAEVYEIGDRSSLLLDSLLERQMKIQIIKNITTEILYKGKKDINNNKIGIIQYLFTKNNRKCYGETCLLINGNEFYLFDIYSIKYDPKEFQDQCAKIIESIVFSKKRRVD